jgi:hypothetical protein
MSMSMCTLGVSFRSLLKRSDQCLYVRKLPPGCKFPRQATSAPSCLAVALGAPRDRAL